MDSDTVQKLKDCEAMLEKLDPSASTALIMQVQEILSKNVEIIAEIDEIRQTEKADEGKERDNSVRVAVLLQQLNFNLNETVKLYQESNKS